MFIRIPLYLEGEFVPVDLREKSVPESFDFVKGAKKNGQKCGNVSVEVNFHNLNQQVS
jgi:hypothetical protein